MSVTAKHITLKELTTVLNIKNTQIKLSYRDDIVLNGCACYGIFYWRLDGTREIQIENGLSVHKQLAVLEHEKGHAVCHINKCRCMRGNITQKKRILREVHAELYALKQLLLYKNIAALNLRMLMIKEHVYRGKVMKTRLWRKCQRYVKQNWPKTLFAN